MFRIATFAAACLLTGAAAAQNLAPATPLAEVAGRTVTYGQVEDYLLRFYGPSGVEHLINHKVLRQEAERLKVEVTEEDFKTRMAALRKEAGPRLPELLKAEGISVEVWEERNRLLLLGEHVQEALWPVTDASLKRLSVRYARTSSDAAARDIISAAKGKIDFELLVLQNSIDKDNGGLVQPDPFLRVENPPFFQLAEQANLREGQVTPRPIRSGEFWLVLKLEKVLPASTLTGPAREAAATRVRLFRRARLLPRLRARYAISRPKLAEALPQTPAERGKTLVGKVGDEDITAAELMRHLVRNYGRIALQALVDRAIFEKEAANLSLTVSTQEVEARHDRARRLVGQARMAELLANSGLTEEGWREMLRYEILGEKIVDSRFLPDPEEMTRISVQFAALPKEADARELIRRSASLNFDQVVKQLGRSGGMLMPDPFLKAENPLVFEAVAKAGVRPGQIVPQPLPVGNRFFVLRLVKRQQAAELSATERAEVVRRLNATRTFELLERLRKNYPVEYPTAFPPASGSAA